MDGKMAVALLGVVLVIGGAFALLGSGEPENPLPPAPVAQAPAAESPRAIDALPDGVDEAAVDADAEQIRGAAAQVETAPNAQAQVDIRNEIGQVMLAILQKKGPAHAQAVAARLLRPRESVEAQRQGVILLGEVERPEAVEHMSGLARNAETPMVIRTLAVNFLVERPQGAEAVAQIVTDEGEDEGIRNHALETLVRADPARAARVAAVVRSNPHLQPLADEIRSRANGR